MKTKGFCIIRTRKGNTVNVYSIATFSFMRNNKYYKLDNSYKCDSFEILENVGGQIIIHLFRKLKHSGIEIRNELTFEQGVVNEIEIEDYISP